MVRFAAFSVGLIFALSTWAAWPKAGAALGTGASAPEIAAESIAAISSRGCGIGMTNTREPD